MSLIYEERCAIIAKVREFSRVQPGELKADFEYCDSGCRRFKEAYTIAVFPNGCNSSMKGFISIHFRRTAHRESVMRKLEAGFRDEDMDGIEKQAELTCILSIMDSEGRKTPPQTFVFCHDFSVHEADSGFRIDDYLSHTELLSEFLPDDTLTLYMDIIFKKTNVKHRTDGTLLLQAYSSFELGVRAGYGVSYFLSLDSPLAELLAQESPVFRRMMVTQMLERTSRRMRVSDESERLSLMGIGRILWGDVLFSFNSVDDILKLYETAEMYIIPAALDTCRRWLGLCMSHENVHEISRLADRYDDDRLRRIVTDFLDSEGNANSRRGIHSFATNRDDQWTFHNVGNGASVGLHFRHGSDDDDNESDSFDFYT